MEVINTNKRRWIFIAILLITGMYLLAFVFNISPYLRGPKTWRWAYAIPGVPERHIVPVLTVVSYCVIAVVWLCRMNTDDNPIVASFLCFTALSIPLIQVALLYPESPDVFRPLFYRTISTGASGVFSVGSIIGNLEEFLSRYPSLMPTFPVHPQRYPPGLPVVFYSVRVMFETFTSLGDILGVALRSYQCHDLTLMRLSNATIASSVIQMALPIISSLIVVPLYHLSKRSIGKCEALWVVAIYPLVPSFAMWSARWDQFYPLLTCTVFTFFWHAFSDSGMRITKYVFFLFLAGLLLSFTIFLSFGPLVILAPMGLTALLWVLPNRQRWLWWRWLTGTLVFISGMLLPWVIYQFIVGNGFLDIWNVSMSYHLGLNRDYWIWLFYHLYDFFTFLGLPLALLYITAIANTIRRGWKDDRAVLPLGIGLALLLMDFSGTSRGEVARVWLFMTPFAVIGAVYGLSRLKTHQWNSTLIVALLAIQLLVFNAFLRVVTTGVTDPPTIKTASLTSQESQVFEANFGDQIALVAYDVEPTIVQPDSKIQVELIWEGLRPILHPYTVFVHLLGQDGSLIAQHDSMPQEGNALTSCWIPGVFIPDSHILTIPDSIQPGEYPLVIGLYYWETGERLSFSGENALQDNRVSIETIVVSAENP